MDKKKRKVALPKNFFQTVRPTISNENALKDVIPVKWKKDESKENVAYSVKERIIAKMDYLNT